MHKILRASYTDSIARHTAENICHAFDFAKYQGTPLNHYIVINFGSQLKAEATTVFARIRDKFRDWLAYAYKKHSKPAPRPTYVYAFERPQDLAHVNWAVHIPEHLEKEFPGKLAKWLERELGELRPFDVKTQKVNPYEDKTLSKYIIKGTDPRYIKYLHLERVASPQGRIWGRRATASPSIGRSARKEAGFIPKLHRDLWKAQLKAA